MGSGTPRFRPSTGGFTHGIRTSYGSFSKPEDSGRNFDIARPQDSDEEEDEDEDDKNEDTDRYRSRSRQSGELELLEVE